MFQHIPAWLRSPYMVKKYRASIDIKHKCEFICLDWQCHLLMIYGITIWNSSIIGHQAPEPVQSVSNHPPSRGAVTFSPL